MAALVASVAVVASGCGGETLAPVSSTTASADYTVQGVGVSDSEVYSDGDAVDTLHIMATYMGSEYSSWGCWTGDDICGRENAPDFARAARDLAKAADELVRTSRIPCVRAVGRAVAHQAQFATSIAPLLARGESIHSLMPDGLAANRESSLYARQCNRILHAAGIPDYGPYYGPSK